MATLVLAAAGAAISGAVGGSVVGLSAAIIGRAAGATLGSIIDQKLLGQGAAPVEVGRIERFRVLGASEGADIARVYGRMRVSGQLIWSSRFEEKVSKSSGGGKGGPSAPDVESYSYSISLAVALCEGEIARVGRIWADGQLMPLEGVTWRLYKGGETQLPDPAIVAIEGADKVPSYRSTAYVVFENLELSKYGNRIPQFSFEVFRRPTIDEAADAPDFASLAQAVTLLPPAGPFSLSTEVVRVKFGKGREQALNGNADPDRSDFLVSMDQLEGDLPGCDAVALPVTWFCSDQRCGLANPRPAVAPGWPNGKDAVWRVSGETRGTALALAAPSGQSLSLETPSDQSVREAIMNLRARGKHVLIKPQLLVNTADGNSLVSPFSSVPGQPNLAAGRDITASKAPGQVGSPDRTAAVQAEIESFVGQVEPGQFRFAGDQVTLQNSTEWSYRRFVLHYAKLCELAGGVDAFCIGQGLRGMTVLRDALDHFPFVEALRALAADVKAILGPEAKVGYAAEWQEYFGYIPEGGTGDLHYHLDALWSDPNIDFVGVENFMPLSDWRDTEGHLDEAWNSIYAPGYLESGVAGGEGYDWAYADDEARAAQDRQPIEDGIYGEDWVYRPKDLVNWWTRYHWDRPNGVRNAGPTDWVPGSKPIWFTALGCAAVDKGANEPELGRLPHPAPRELPTGSDGRTDDYIQLRYVQAALSHWKKAANNPHSDIYDAPMVDLSRCFLSGWDVRPWPAFPQLASVWPDTEGHATGPSLTGRSMMIPLAQVVRDVCARSGVGDVDVSELFGAIRGCLLGGFETARQSLQPLMMSYGFDCFEEGAVLKFRNRQGQVAFSLDPGMLVVGDDGAETLALSRAPDAEGAERVRIGFVESDRNYQAGAAEAVMPTEGEPNVSQSDMPVVLTSGEAKSIAERWLSEARVARDTLSFVLPMSDLSVGPGDIVSVPGDGRERLYRIDRIEEGVSRRCDAVRIERSVYGATRDAGEVAPQPVIAPLSAAQVYAEFMDLPMLTGNEVPHAPHIAVTATPWPGSAVVYAASQDYGYSVNTLVERNAVMGDTLTALPRAKPGLWSNAELRVRLSSGQLQSLPRIEVLNGKNVAAIRSGDAPWEVFQFETATLVETGVYLLTGLLRGQAGTDAFLPDVWPEGSDFVLLDGAPIQLSIQTSERGLERNYRVGEAGRAYDDPSFLHHVDAFDGIGLRPFSPVHLKARRLADGAISVNWIRRTRLDGDSWIAMDVPLSEAFELYLIRITVAGSVVREVTAASPQYQYSLADKALDGAQGTIRFEIAQVSEIFGPGAYAEVEFDA